MALFKSALENSLDSLRKLQAARQSLESSALADSEKLTTLRASQGEAALAELLDGADSGPLRAEMYGLTVHIESLEAARPKLLAKIRDAILEVGKARAAGKRKEADKIRERLTAHNLKLSELRKSLEDFAGCPFEASQYALEPGVNYHPDMLPRPAMSIAARLEMELLQVAQEAQQIEQQAQQAANGGAQSFETLEAALKACEDIERMMPTSAAVTVWYPSALATADALWTRHIADFAGDMAQPQRVAQIYLAWDGEGKINLTASQVRNRQAIPARPQAVPFGGKAPAPMGPTMKTAAAVIAEAELKSA